MQNYLINDNTLAILPYGEKASLIVEKNNKFIIRRKPNYIIKTNCTMHGSSYQGRIDGTKVLTGYTYKAPIIIEDKSSLIFFPTSSPRLDGVAWINLGMVDYAYKCKEDKTNRIKFINGLSIRIDSSLNILNNQILRATRLMQKLAQNNG